MDGALALAGRYAAPRSASRASRRRPTTSSGGSSSSGSRTRSRLRGRRGVVTTAATPRSRSAGRGSRLSARADAIGGRAALCRPPAAARPARRDEASGSATAEPWHSRASTSRAGRARRRARRPERIRQDDAASCRRRARSARRRDVEVAGAPAGSGCPCRLGTRARRAGRLRRAHRRRARRARARLWRAGARRPPAPTCC